MSGVEECRRVHCSTHSHPQTASVICMHTQACSGALQAFGCHAVVTTGVHTEAKGALHASAAM